MNIFNRLYCRIYQGIFKLAMPILPYRTPILEKSVTAIPKILKDAEINNCLIVTDASIKKLGLTKDLEDCLEKASINFSIYDGTIPNPTISNIEEAKEMYIKNNCEAIIAFGGGSVMDCAKITGARVVKPKQPVQKMKGLLKIRKKLPLLIAIPTTAGTGSETTLAAVITDEKTHHKYPINDFNLIPHYAILDYKNTLGLPPHITSTTGMDALTHAIEAYIGKSTTKETRNYAEKATKLIVRNLKKAYDNGSNNIARENMLLAAYYAGIAFTKSYVGYVHSVAHSLGGKYGVPHGLANAIILPYFLEEYGKKCENKLAKLAKLSQIAKEEDSTKEASQKFIQWIKNTNNYMNIPEKIDSLKEEDIPELAKKASSEANPLYPVPLLMNAKELEKMYYKLLK